MIVRSVVCHLSLATLAAFGLCAGAVSAPRALVIAGPSVPPAEAGALSRVLTRAGYGVRSLGFGAALSPGALDGAALVALPDATRLPAGLHAPLERFLRAGGDLIAFGLPAWKVPLLKVGGKWVSADAYAEARAFVNAPHPVIDFGTGDLSRWTRSSDQAVSKTTYEIVSAGPVRALHATLPNLTSWDTLASPETQNPFPAGADRTVFAAKGDADTKALVVEWMERDGARWIATVPLTEHWRRYELAPDAFHFWPSAKGRGGPGDRLRPENAARFSVGLAFSHSGAFPGRHAYWFANLGTASAQDAPLSGLHLAERLDGLYPAWKSFPVHDIARLSPAAGAPVAFPAFRVSGFSVRSPHPRPSGAGFEKGRTVRFVPLLEARSPSGAWRGVPGAAYIHTDGPYRGSVWSVFGFPLSAALKSAAFAPALEEAARWMRGPLLAEGGSAWYTVSPDQPVRLGARAIGTAPGDTVRIALTDTAGHTAWAHTWPAGNAPVSATWMPPPGARGPWNAAVTLSRGGSVLDRITQPIHVWAPRKTPHFVTARDGSFMLDGKAWKAHGVNYMPSSGIARDPADTDFEYWMGRSAYDTQVVARDLDTIKRLGLNAVSIFIYADSLDSGNLLDILRLCDERGLKVNLSLRPGTPMDFQWEKIRPIIEKYRLAEDDVVFMYDLAWEPQFGDRASRAPYDPLWTAWVTKRYGSLSAATAAWGYTPERNGGTLVNPEDAQTVSEGPWTKMVVDYRRFLNGLLAERYGAARRLVRTVDPNHLVSFRMTETSNPTYDWPGSLPYDFEGLTDAVDLFAPEAYGRRGDWEATKPGVFQVQYARAVNPALPVIWAEAGESTWEPGLDEASPARKDLQGREFAALYRMLLASGSNGIFWWWYPGGYRANEDSDYGIINPDGTDRPATKVIRDNAKRFFASPAPVPTDAEVTIRLDDASGLFGAYQAAKDAFWRLVEQGRTPRLVIDRRE